MIKDHALLESYNSLFVAFPLLIGALIRQICKRYSFIPYTPTLFVLGIIIGSYSNNFSFFSHSIEKVINMDPHGFLAIFLPPLIFQSSFNADAHIFKKQAKQIVFLATVSVLVSAFLIMIGIKAILNYDNEIYTWFGAFLLGSILSCTDPVAVLALLKEVGAPIKFNSLIESESVFNDGTCMVLFTVCAQIMKGNDLSIIGIIWLFLSLAAGGFIFGMLGGMLFSYLIQKFKYDPILSLNLSVCFCFIIFFIAENVNLGIKLSGILSLVGLGLYISAFGKTKISAQAKQTMHHFWKYLVFASQTAIFLTAGIIVGGKVLTQSSSLLETQQFYKLGILYLIMQISRFLSISVFMPLLKNWGYGLTWKQIIVLTYGGLRGATGIAFSLIIFNLPFLNINLRKMILLHMSGCTFLTLVVNASTAGWIIKKVGLNAKQTSKQKLFYNFVQNMYQNLSLKLQNMKNQKYLEEEDWLSVKQSGGINDLKELIKQHKQKQRKLNQKQFEIQLQQNPMRQILIQKEENQNYEILVEYRNRFILAFKGILWQKFQNHECNNETVIILTQAADWDLDNISEALSSWDFIENVLKNKQFVSFCYKFKQYPVIGKYFKKSLFNYIASTYDTISTYCNVLDLCQSELNQMNSDKKILQKITQQSLQNKNFALDFLEQFTKISFPQIVSEVQINNFALFIINHGKQILKNEFKYEQISKKQFQQIQNIFNSQIEDIQSFIKIWNQPQLTPIEYLKQSSFFSSLHQHQLKQLIDNKIDLLVSKSETIVRENQKVRYIYYIIKGEGSQQSLKTNQSYRRKLKKLQFIGAYDALQNRSKYTTTFTTDSIMVIYGFPVKNIIEIIKTNEQAEGYMYKFCLPIIVKIQKGLQNLCYFNEKILQQFSQRIFYNVYQQNVRVHRSFLDLLIKGTIQFDNNLKQEFYCIDNKVNPECKFFQSKSKCLLLQLPKDEYENIMQLYGSPSVSNQQHKRSSRISNYFITSNQLQNRESLNKLI